MQVEKKQATKIADRIKNNMLLPLTDIQVKTFQAIKVFIQSNNYPPTIPEIQKVLDIENPGQVHKIFTALEKKGYIIREKGRHRGLDLSKEVKEKLQ